MRTRGSARGSRTASPCEVAFTAFVKDFSDAMLRAAFVLLGSRQEAEDAVQAALLRTLRRWGTAEAAPQAYSRVVLVNVCRERWRQRSRHPEVLDDAHRPRGQHELASFSDALERRYVISAALSRLPEVQREVLACRYLLDASVSETAKTLGIAEGTVKSATSRGLEALRELLSGEESEDNDVRCELGGRAPGPVAK
jgi:RNA polymerase sigma factor (sigma-70 family)